MEQDLATDRPEAGRQQRPAGGGVAGGDLREQLGTSGTRAGTVRVYAGFVEG